MSSVRVLWILKRIENCEGLPDLTVILLGPNVSFWRTVYYRNNITTSKEIQFSSWFLPETSSRVSPEIYHRDPRQRFFSEYLQWSWHVFQDSSWYIFFRNSCDLHWNATLDIQRWSSQDLPQRVFQNVSRNCSKEFFWMCSRKSLLRLLQQFLQCFSRRFSHDFNSWSRGCRSSSWNFFRSV